MDTILASDIWKDCLKTIEPRVTKQAYITWFEPIIPIKFDENKLIISVPSQFFYEIIESRFNSQINQAIKEVIGEDAQLRYQVKEILGQEERTNYEKPPEQEIQIVKQNKKVDASNLKFEYTFDNFIQGENNKFARGIAVAVAENPGKTSFNPMVIYGSTGLGKTHLIQAIGNEALKKQDRLNVYYGSADKFTNDFVDCLKKNKPDEFSNYCKSRDVLIIDDIQYFAGRERTQDVLFDIFNTLHQNSKQIILSSDKPPKDLKGIPERLISRFQWGYTVDIQPPDFETRIAILQKKCEAMNLDINEEILEFIASVITTNIRELEGTLIGLSGDSISTKEITLELTKQVLKRVVGTNTRKDITIDYIQKTVCEYYKISEILLRDKTRKQEIVLARQVAMYFCRQLTDLSLNMIGLHFGGRDHATVIHSHKCILELISSNERIKNDIANIKKKIDMLI